MPPKSGNNPTCAKLSPKVASSAAMRKSHASAIFIPPPAAAPLMLAITGLVIVAIARMISLPASSSAFNSEVALRLRASCSIFRSPPAQNARPSPVIITA